MSFSEDCVRFGDELAKLVDAGVAVKDAAAAVGISRGRCYAILRATGRPAGRARSVRSVVDSSAVVAVFEATGSINQAAKANGISHGRARRVLVDGGVIGKGRQPRGKAQSRVRFIELLDAGWSAGRRFPLWPHQMSASVILGARTGAQLRGALSSEEVTLPDVVRTALNEISRIS